MESMLPSFMRKDEENIDQNEELSSEESSEESEIEYEAYLSPTDTEKKNILSFALELRNESTFCDVAFLVKGSLFRAHRVIVGSWSRWLRALLSDGPEEEVVCLDMFTADAFGNILDYMYGKPFLLTVENAEGYMKVLRRLEMQHLEQQCWEFLISVIDSSNCEKLHEMADVFDCPPLKLCAWRILQEAIPGYSVAPNHMLNLSEDQQKQITYQLKGNGLTGPCDIDQDYTVENEEDEAIPNIFREEENTPLVEELDKGEDAESTEKNVHEDVDSVPPMHPKALPKNASATEAVNVWADYLQYVYKQCQPPPGTEMPGIYEQEEDQSETDSDTSIALKKKKKRSKRRKHKNVPRRDRVDWHAELTRFYRGIDMENKLNDLDNIMLSWEGKEELMLESLRKKYHESIPNDLQDHIQKLLLYVDGDAQAENYQ